jgi:hypothetical protein
MKHCRAEATVSVVWAWDGALAFPSLYHLCEDCADEVCDKIERGAWTNGARPAYIYCCDFAPDFPRECQNRFAVQA